MIFLLQNQSLRKRYRLFTYFILVKCVTSYVRKSAVNLQWWLICLPIFSNGKFASSDPSLNLTAEIRQSFHNIGCFSFVSSSLLSLPISCMYCCCPLSHIWTLYWQQARPERKTNSFTRMREIASLRHDISKELIQARQTIKKDPKLIWSLFNFLLFVGQTTFLIDSCFIYTWPSFLDMYNCVSQNVSKSESRLFAILLSLKAQRHNSH